MSALVWPVGNHGLLFEHERSGTGSLAGKYRKPWKNLCPCGHRNHLTYNAHRQLNCTNTGSSDRVTIVFLSRPASRRQ